MYKTAVCKQLMATCRKWDIYNGKNTNADATRALLSHCWDAA